MKRHDTHLLSDSEEEEEISSEKHKYSFNNSKNSFNKSENNSLYSNNSKKDSPFNLKHNINFNNNDNTNNNDNMTNISIISSKELENIFFEENNISILSKNKKEEKKEKKNEESNNNKKEKKISEKYKSQNMKKEKISYNNKEEKILDNNKKEEKSENNVKNEKSDKNVKEEESWKKKNNEEIVSKKANEDIKELIDIKPKTNRNIENIKIKLVRFNNNENNNELFIRFYTYTNSLKNKIKINERKCISLNNSFINYKKKNRRHKNKNNNIKYSVKSTKKKKFNLLSHFDSNNSSCNNELDENNKNIKSLIDIINKKKIKSLKVCKNSFSIKKKIINPILLDGHQNHINNDDNIGKKVDALIIKNKIQHQNDFYLKKANKFHNIKRIEYFPSNKIQINGRKSFQFIHQVKKLNDNYYSSSNLISSNNSRFNNSNKNINVISTMNKFNNSKKLNKNAKLKLKNDKKIKILYDLYCKRPETYKKNMPRIKSAFSVNENNHKKEIYDKINEYNIYKKQTYLNDNKNYNDKKNWLFRLIKLKKVKNIYHYDKHFGNSESCPLCQEMDKKNEESIKKKGIRSNIQENKKNDSKISLPKRRIYSAYSKYYTKKNKIEPSKNNLNFENDNDINKDKNSMNINIGCLNNIIDKEKNISFNKMLKLKLNKVNHKENIFQNSANNNI